MGKQTIKIFRSAHNLSNGESLLNFNEKGRIFPRAIEIYKNKLNTYLKLPVWWRL